MVKMDIRDLKNDFDNASDLYYRLVLTRQGIPQHKERVEALEMKMKFLSSTLGILYLWHERQTGHSPGPCDHAPEKQYKRIPPNKLNRCERIVKKISAKYQLNGF